jgi:hypothetical protein
MPMVSSTTAQAAVSPSAGAELSARAVACRAGCYRRHGTCYTCHVIAVVVNRCSRRISYWKPFCLIVAGRSTSDDNSRSVSWIPVSWHGQLQCGENSLSGFHLLEKEKKLQKLSPFATAMVSGDYVAKVSSAIRASAMHRKGLKIEIEAEDESCVLRSPRSH